MFINSIFLYLRNVRSRTSRRTIENSPCRGETTRSKRKRSNRVQAGCRKGYNHRGIEKDSRELCKQVEQYLQHPKAKGNERNTWSKGKEFLTSLSFFYILIFILGYFISATIFGYLDNGLYSSILCLNEGITDTCLEELSNAR